MSGALMTEAEIEREVIETISKVAKVPVERLSPSVDIRKDLRFDSLMGLRVLAALEKRFGVTVPDEEIETRRTIASAVALIHRLTRERR
jgi:acyl carrier protein